MKISNFFSKWLFLPLVLLTLSVSDAWGASTSTLTFTAKCNGSGTAGDGVSWTVNSDGSESNFDDTKGIHYGTNMAAVQYITLSTSGISGTITQVVVNASTASDVSATVSVTVGGSAFGGDAQTLSSSATNYTFTGSAAGTIVVTITKPSSATKAIYCKSVAVTYSTASCDANPAIGTASLNGSFSLSSVGVQCASITPGTNCSVASGDYGFIWYAGTGDKVIDGEGVTKVAVTSGAYSSGSFSKNLTGSFSVGNTYTFRAFATNGKPATVYSDAVSFTPRSITFNSKGGSSVATKYVNSGTVATAPTAPTKTGYDFGGWYQESTLENAVNWSSTISENKTYYAKWTETLHDVTVAYKCGATTLQSSTTIENVGIETTGTTTAPASFTGYTWSTWSAMPSGVTTSTTPLTNRTIVINATADSKTITANYTANQYDITYKDQGGGAFSGTQTSAPTKHTYGTATTLKIPTKVGYDFGGWYTSSDCSTGAVGTSVSASLGATDYTNNIVLYAKWTLHDYTISSSLTNCTASPSIPNSYTYTGSAAGLSYTISPSSDMYGLPSTISVSGVSYTWTPATGVLTLTGTISSNVSITIAAQPKVIWMAGGQVFNTQQGASGTTLSTPGTPSSATYCDGSKTFVGWSASEIIDTQNNQPADLFTDATKKTIPAGGTTYYAVFATSSGTPSTSYAAITSGLASGNYVIAYEFNNNNTRIALQNVQDGDNSTSKMEGYALARTDSKYANPADTYIWQLQEQNDGTYYIYDLATGLYLNATTSALQLSTTATKYDIAYDGTNSRWTIRLNSSNTYYVHGYVNNTTIDFRVSTSASDSRYRTYLYKNEGSQTFSAYATACCKLRNITLASSGSVTGGTFESSVSSACEDATVTLTATPSAGYIFNGWTVTGDVSDDAITVTNNQFTMPDEAVTVSAAFSAISSIAVKTAPTKTTYCQGEYFDPTGLVITATYANSETEDIPYSGNEAKFTFSPTLSTGLAPSNTSVSITYAAKNTTQNITVNASRTISLTGSGTVTGGTFSADNSTACVGATITLTATPNTHYSLGNWTVTGATSGNSIDVTSNQFTMPDENVTVNATFAEDEYKTVVFQNNGINMYTGAGYDATNNWKQKVYVGDSPVKPTDLTDGYGSGDACNATSTLFYGWTKETWDDEIEEKSTLDARTGNQKVYGKSAALPVVAAEDPSTITYHAVWAAGSGSPAITPPTPIVYWAKQSLSTGNSYSATSGSGSLSTNVSMTSNSYPYVYTNTNISSAPVITLSGLNLSGASTSTVSISFFTRGSKTSAGPLTVSYYNNLAWTDLATTATVQNGEVAYHEIAGIPKTATSVKLTHSTSSGSFSIGTIRIFEANTTEYTFTELDGTNTDGWTNNDWDGYYLITNASTYALDGNGIGEKNFAIVSPSDNKIVTTNIGAAFDVTYVSENGYKLQGVGSGDYLNTASNSVAPSASVIYHSSMSYNSVVDNSSNTLKWNSSKFGFYASAGTAIKLYKILSSYSTFLTTCCTQYDISGASTSGTAVTGGTLTSTDNSACEDREVKITANVSDGYRFDSWTITAGGSPVARKDGSAEIEDGNPIYVFDMPAADVTVSAAFTRVYTVTYDANGGTGEMIDVNSPYAAGDKVTVLTNTFTKAGYNFDSWSYSPAVSVTDGKFDMPSSDVTITAQWTAKPLNNIILAQTEAEIYDQQYVQIDVTYDPADIVTKGYTLTGPALTKVVTTGSTQTQLKISATKAGVVISEEVKETVSIKANADNTKTASVEVTIKPLPSVHFVDIVHNVVFADVAGTIEANALVKDKTTPTTSDFSGTTYNTCEEQHEHLVGWIESSWADEHPEATHSEIAGAGAGVFYTAGASIDVDAQNGKTFYAVWSKIE